MKMGKFEKSFVNTQRHARRAIDFSERLLPYANPQENQNCLEVGCGAGAVSHHIAKKYQLSITGTDVDPEQIEQARNSIKDVSKIRFVAANATDLPFNDEKFDIVLSYMVLHHISNWLDALKEIKRVLKPGGYYIIGELTFPKFLVKIAGLFMHKYGITTVGELKAFMGENGFTEFYASKSKDHLFSDFEGVFRRE